jgi:hypothetical protein
MKRFLKIIAAIYVVNAALLVAGMVWAWRYLRETDDAEWDDDWDWDEPWSDDIVPMPVPTLPPRDTEFRSHGDRSAADQAAFYAKAVQPKPGIPTGRVFDMRGTEYRFDQETSTFQPVQVNNNIQGETV